MSAVDSLACPTCNSTSLRHHCDKDHPTCDWFVCTRCKSYGVPSRPDRWAVKR